MKKILSIIVLFILFVSCDSKQNRYELISSSESNKTRTMLIDKRTGTIWILGNNKWKNLGTPPIDAPITGSIYEIK